MPINTYACSACGFRDEYVESFSTTKDLWHPEKCPKCGIGKLEKVFEGCKWDIDVIGGFDYTYGKKNWRLGKTKGDIARVLAGEKDPY